MSIKPLLISAYTTTNALGKGVEQSVDALHIMRGGLRPCDFEDVALATWIGKVEGLENEAIDGELAAYDCRNHRLARLGLEQDGFSTAVEAARARYGATRIGVFIGTSTSGILQTEHAYAAAGAHADALPACLSFRHTHDVFAAAEFCRAYLGLSGPALAYSTACSSSAKVFAAAYHYMQAGLCDAAVVGGVDSLCMTTLYGFNSLDLISSHRCRPWDRSRDGLNIGEAAGFALLEWSGSDSRGVALRGYGESSDAYHMSAPHPQGTGAVAAMEQALQRAGLTPSDLDYVNLHGTATPANDAAEDLAVTRVFGHRTPCSSTKGWTGHALGAAGITEAVFACLCIEHGFIPGSLNTCDPDPALSANIVLETRAQRVSAVLSNAFGFGGTNCSLLFGVLP